MSDGQIILDTRINNKGAEADLQILRAKAKATAKQIGQLDKDLGTAKTRRSKLEQDLAAAKAEAEQTGKALDALAAKLDRLRGDRATQLMQQYPTISKDEANESAAAYTAKHYAKDYAESEKLSARYDKQTATVDKLSAAYDQQGKEIEALNTRRADLTAQLGQERTAVKTSTVMIDAAKALPRVLQSVRQFGTKAFGLLQRGAARFAAGLRGAHQAAHRLRTRLLGLVSGALIFNVLSAGLRTLTGYFGTAAQACAPLRNALQGMQSNASLAANALVQALAPALTALANAAATLFGFLARLFSLFTGKAVTASADAAAGLASVGGAASDAGKEVQKSLAGFDEIERLQAPAADTGGGGGGTPGGTTALAPSTPLLDDILEAIRAGDWLGVGRLIGEKLRDAMDAVPWSDIQEKAARWARNLAQTINGLISTPNLWQSLGHTVAQGLNTVTLALDTWFHTVQWQTLGKGLGDGLHRAVLEIDWPRLGRTLTNGLRAVLETLHGFLNSGFDWAMFGQSVGAMLVAAVGNIDWVQAAADLSKLAVGLLTALNAALAQIDWAAVGQTILQMLCAIDWAGLLSQLGQLVCNLFPVIFPALLLSAAKGVLSLVLAGVTQAAVTGVANLFTTSVLPAALTALQGFFTGFLPSVLSSVAGVLSSIVAAVGGWPVVLISALIVVGGAILGWLYKHNEQFRQGVDDLRNWILSAISSAGTALTNLWSNIWSGIGAVTQGWVDKIKGLVQGIMDFIGTVRDGLGGLTSGAIDAVKGRAAEADTHAIPAAATFSAPIPALATGAVLPANRAFLAMVGDQRRGTNVEAPLDTIKQAVAEVFAAMSAAGDGQPINIYLGDELLDSVIASSQSRRLLRSGGR